MNSSRLYWVDFAKALCMFFICLAHCGIFYKYPTPLLDKFYYPFYVNAFFFLSGYFIFKKQLFSDVALENRKQYLHNGAKKYVLNVIFTLLIPSLIFSSIFYIPKVLSGKQIFSIEDMLGDTIGGGTYWFISALIICYIMLFVPFLLRIKNIWFYYVLGILSALLGYYVIAHYNSIPNIWMFKNGLIALIYLVSGGVFYKYEKKYNNHCGNKFHLLLLVAYLYVIYIMNPKLSTSKLLVNSMSYVASISITLVLVYISRKMVYSKVLSFIGQNTILFYFVSGGFPFFISMFFLKLPYHNSIMFSLVIFLSMLSSYVFAYIINKYFPFLRDLRKGVAFKKKQ